MLFLPGVSGSASCIVTSPPANRLAGFVSKRVIPTVPGPDCRMNAYQEALGTGAPGWSSWPGGTGLSLTFARGPDRMLQPSTDCAVVWTMLSAVVRKPP